MANTGKKKQKKKFSISKIFAEAGNGIDIPFLSLVLVLLIFGLVMLYSASYVKGIYSSSSDPLLYVGKQRICGAAGFAAMIFISHIDYNYIRRYSLAIWALAIVLLIGVFAFEPLNGCRRWIYLPGVGSFQPSELAKFAIILNFARVLESKSDKLHKIVELRYFAFLVLPVLVLLAFEPHNSCIIIILALCIMLMFVGGVDLKYFIIGIALVVIVAAGYVAINWHNADAYFISRLKTFFDSRGDDNELRYQTLMSLLAIGSGKWFGVGIGNSRQKHLHLPERQNDFIYAIVVEELGFVGGLILIILFVALFVRGVYIATHAKDKFGSLITFGIVGQIALQAGLNIAVNTNIIPNTGVSLPFFSSGGTALLLLMCELGLVLSVSRSCITDEEDKDESDNSSRRYGRAHKSGARDSSEN